MSKASDVIVIGAGVVGCAAAYYLAKRGVKVTVLERREVACGASGRNGSGARQSGRDNRELPLAMFGVKHIWPTLGEELGEDIEYIQNGNMRLGKTEKDREALEELVRAIDAALPKKLVLDMEGVTFMDSSGIALILRAQQRMQLLDGSLLVRNVPQQARRVLDAAGIGRLVTIR